MNIVRKENESHLFCDVNVGEVFEYGDSIFMKLGETSPDYSACKAICLEDGIVSCFLGNEEIQPVNADLVIH